MSGTPSRSGSRALERAQAGLHTRSRSDQLSGPTSSAHGGSRRAPSFDAGSSRRKPSDPHLVAPAARSNVRLEDRNGDAAPGLSRWETAVGNIEDARVAFDVLARAVDDAVYLDEDAFSRVAPVAQYNKVIQTQQRRITQLESQLRETRMQLDESNSIQTEALQRHAEMQQELENNAIVFQMHYQELLAKDDEIQKLTTVIQALSGK